jgi:hypothetical protein
MVIARGAVISEPLRKVTIRLVRRLANGSSVAAAHSIHLRNVGEIWPLSLSPSYAEIPNHTRFLQPRR